MLVCTTGLSAVGTDILALGSTSAKPPDEYMNLTDLHFTLCRESRSEVRFFPTSTVAAKYWENNLHYGSSNVFRADTIPEEDVGGTNIINLFGDRGAIVAYANAHHEGGGPLGSWHNLPYISHYREYKPQTVGPDGREPRCPFMSDVALWDYRDERAVIYDPFTV